LTEAAVTDDDEEDLEEPRSPGRPGLPVDFTRLMRGVVRRWRWIAIAAVVSAGVGFVLAKTIAPRTFISRTVIVWEARRDQDRQEFRTLIDSVLIPANLLEVKRRIKSPHSIDVLALSVEVFFDPQSDVVSLEASAGTAKDAARLAETVIAVFLDYCRQLQRARGEAALQELKTNLDVARASLANSQQVYDAFRRENNITDMSAETSLAIQNAATLRSLAEAARGDALAEAARARALDESSRRQREIVVTGQTQSDPNGEALAAVRTELLAARGRLSADHPRIASLEAQAIALQSGGEGARTTVSSGQNAQLAAIRAAMAQSETARAAALERQQVYSENAAQAREQLQKLSAVEGQAAILLSDVTTAANHVTDLDAQVGPAEEALRNVGSAFRVIAPAAVPPHASSGKGKLYAGGIPAITLAIVLFALLCFELRGLRVHTAREAAFWLNGPAVGASTWPRVSDALDELLDELADCAQAATGNTLVVGASPGDETAAAEIAAGLRQRTTQATRTSDPPSAPRALIGATSATAQRVTPNELLSSTSIVATDPPSQRQPAATAIQTWDSGERAITLRRASRLSDRVIVVLTSNTLAMTRLAAVRTRLGRDHAIAVVVVGLDPALSDLPDRVGDVDSFWYTNEFEVG